MKKCRKKLAAVCFLFCCLTFVLCPTTIAQSEEAVEIPAGIKEYDMLPPETKKMVTRSDFVNLRSTLTRMDARAAIERMFQNGLGDIARVGFAKPPIAFTDDQLGKLKDLQTSFKDRLKGLREKVQRDFPKLSLRERVEKENSLRKEFFRDLVDGFSDVLSHEQAIALSNWDSRFTGLPRALVEFHLGTSIDVDEKRLERIRDKLSLIHI